MKNLLSSRVAAAALALILCGLGMVESGRGGAERQVGEELSASADVGRVLDREGVAARRGVLADRWGPVEEGTPLEAGDWLEVGTRGANALRMRLAGGAELILGPGTLVEVVEGNRIGLLRGEVEVDASAGAAVEVAGPGEAEIRVDERAVLRARNGRLVRLEEDPRWLVGYESNASTEALGSLLVNIDGRNVPLTIGYHKVTVDIHDQIARTVIEESFVNHTSTVLEGVFYFPLPADSSISGFGMWIGNELVQGEIVEKQRAREIYETILRERRDPGLLEWTGGNIFKARVYPIGHEKRIRIAYTQVLPKKGDAYTYHYALQSELLRKNPLGRLEIEVNVSSAERLASVECPSHECRIRTAEHSAKVEFSAEEFAPERDFELRIAAQPRKEGLTVIPHRRGDDGYFMLLVDAPEVVPLSDGAGKAQPIEVLVLADTSGSMWGAPQVSQVAFVEALIASLGEDDAFNLATCDVETRWAFERPIGNSLENREQALHFLEQRDPLGWSDLEQAFVQAFERAGSRTHVVYVGDGVPTSGDADPVALAHELKRLYRGNGTFHAVVPGSSSEVVVLRALSGLGGGSVRTIGGGTDPARAAFGLLEEIAAPAVKDLKLSFEGLAVAAVYPEVLPNLPAGGQQIVVGRFDPTGGDLAGSVVLTGSLDGQLVRLATEVALDGDDEGNSFIPRLWARHHLDQLLEQGSSGEVQERIVTMSEDYQIVTPYTSFLVLESDADRERFGVKKSFRMRDGEEFFTAGRESGRHELLQKQMLAAKSWRKRMREGVLDSLQDMGRGLTELLRGYGPAFDQVAALGYLETGSIHHGGGGRYGNRNGWSDSWELEGKVRLGEDFEQVDERVDELADYDAREADEQPATEAEMPRQERMNRLRASAAKRVAGPSSPASAELYRSVGFSSRRAGLLGGRAHGYNSWDPFASLFPGVPTVRGSDPEWTWPDDVVELLGRLDRRAMIASGAGAWRFEVDTTFADARGREQTMRGLHLIGPEEWLVLDSHVRGNVYGVQWMADGRRGLMTEGWRMGRARAAQEGDAGSWSAPFAWHFGDQVRSFLGYEARVEELEGGRTRVVFSIPTDPDSFMALSVDVEHDVVLEQTWSSKGEETRGLRFDGFHEVGGLWWPGEVRSWNAKAQGETTTIVRVESLATEEHARLVRGELERRGDAILLGGEESELVDAKQAARDGEANLDQRWLLLRYYARTQRWDAARPHLEAIAESVGEKPGLALIRTIYLQQSRRNEELRLLLLQTAAEIAEAPRDADYGIATQILQHTHSLNQGDEVLELLEVIHPVFTRQEEILDAELAWDLRQLGALANLNRPEQLFEARRLAARKWPFAIHAQLTYASALVSRWELDAALEWLETAEAENGPWAPHELTQVRRATMNMLWSGYRLEQLVGTFEEWERENDELLDQSLFDQFLSALIYLDREREAWKHIESWLALSANPERRAVENARLQAALQHALGHGHQLYHQRLEDDRALLLAGVGRVLALESEDTYMAGQILQHRMFRQTGAGRALLAELYDVVDESVAELPGQKVQSLINWLRGAAHRTDEPGAWQPILERVFERWLASEDEGERPFLVQVVLAHGAPELKIRALRRTLVEAETAEKRVMAASNLYQALLQQPWSEEVQAELVSLLPTLVLPGSRGSDVVSANLDQRVIALYELVSWALQARTESIVTGLPEFELMTRRTLAAERGKALREVRAATADLLTGLERSLESGTMRDWAAIERIYLHIKGRNELESAWTSSLELLAQRIEALEAAEDPDQIPVRDRILALRCIATCSNLLVRADEDQLAQRLGPFRILLDRLIETKLELPDGRGAVRDLLIALDRGDELETALASWFEGGEELAKIRWGRDRAHVLAERGRLEEAAEVLEEIDRIDELTPDDVQTLSGWYTALDQPERAREGKIRSYEVMGEDQLWQDLYQRQHAYQRSGDEVPPELDPEIPVRFIALMRKARDPQNRFHLLRNYYQTTKDYRLLECIPEAVLGQSAQKIYPVLNQVGSLARLIDEEATVDRIQAHLAGLHEHAETDVDRRALRLLQFQIVLRAARQSHGTERHAERSLRAVGETFRTGWQEGEVGMMAEFLAAQGTLQPEALAEEQLRQLRELSHVASDPDERLTVAHHLSRMLWGYSRHDDAVRTLAAALAVRRNAAGGRLPQSANEPLRELSTWLVSQRSLRRAEALWLTELEADHPAQQMLWLKEQLYGVWRDAVLVRAEVSLGRGERLYVAVVDSMQHDLATRSNEGHALQVLSILRDLWYRAHHDLHLARVPEDATGFAFSKLPDVLDLYQYRGGQSMVSQMADLLHNVRDAHTALEFLVARAETEPRWLRLRNQDFWSQHAWRFGDLLSKVGTPRGVLEQRALAVVLAELRQDLRSRQSRNRTVYDKCNGHFWTAKRADFLDTALGFLEEHRDSPYAIAWATEYAFRGLGAHDEAIAALTGAWHRGILHLEGRDQLGVFLQLAGRWSESIPVAVELVEERPAVARYHVMLMKGHFHTDDHEALVRVFHQAESWFRGELQWTEKPIAELAHGCLETQLFEDSARLFDEAIALHVRTAPKRGIGDGVLADYYHNQAGAYSGLGRTSDAVDAAAGAIVSWGNHISQRNAHLIQLVKVLDESRNLDGYVASLDAEVETSGLDNPIVRKALGQVFLRRGDHERSAEQLRRALRAAPNDAETHQLLLQAYEHMRRPELAADALLEWARMAGHELHLYADVGRRLGSLEHAERSERAFTNLVELSPNESEGHQLLAEVREQQDLWDDAAASWRHVARIRTKEPTGYLRLARAMIRMERLNEALEVIDHLRSTSWPSRFGNVHREADDMLKGIYTGG